MSGLNRRNGTAWRPSDTDTLIEMHSIGYIDEEIAAVTGHSRETVTRRRLALGLGRAQRNGAALFLSKMSRRRQDA